MKDRSPTGPVTHELKTWPAYYGAVACGLKPFEVRKADRDFRVGDLLHLREWDPETQTYTGASLIRSVTYVLKGGQFGVEVGYVVLGLH